MLDARNWLIGEIPADLDYHSIAHLWAEAKEKLSAFRPGTLGQASRISGITPADITVIQIHLKKNNDRVIREHIQQPGCTQ